MQTKEFTDCDSDGCDRRDPYREWRSRLLSYLTSGSVHVILLLMLAAMFLTTNNDVERPPVRTLASIDMPEPVLDEPPEMMDPVDVEIVIDADSQVDEQEIAKLELIDESEAVIDDTIDSPAIADAIDAQTNPAIGGGANGGGFQRGGVIGVGTGVSFMGSKPVQRGEAIGRLLYIIDMSGSLKEDQLALIKNKLSLSLSDLTKMDRFNVLFFSGPCWLPGDDMREVHRQWKQNGNDWHDFSPLAGLPIAKWERCTPSYRRDFTDYLADLKRSGGTDWRHPFKVAYSMDPKPQCIFFLTDGAVNNSEETVDLVKANLGIPVHTIAFGVNNTAGVNALAEMAEVSTGSHVAYDAQDIADMYSKLLQNQGKDVQQVQ